MNGIGSINMTVFMEWTDEVNNIDKESIESLDLPNLKKIDVRIKKATKMHLQITETVNQLKRKNPTIFSKDEIQKWVIDKGNLLIAQKEKLELAFLKHHIGVFLPPKTYYDTHHLKDRIVVFGCGHRFIHHSYKDIHKDSYCVDLISNNNPDVIINIENSKSMEFLSSDSFSKVILESLPIEIFNHGSATKIFKQMNRILIKDGLLEFNPLFSHDDKSDHGNPFIVQITPELSRQTYGRAFKEASVVCQKYHNQIIPLFKETGFKFQERISTFHIPNKYVLKKI